MVPANQDAVIWVGREEGFGKQKFEIFYSLGLYLELGIAFHLFPIRLEDGGPLESGFCEELSFLFERHAIPFLRRYGNPHGVLNFFRIQLCGFYPKRACMGQLDATKLEVIGEWVPLS